MNRKLHCPNTVAAPVGRYSQAVEIGPGARYLFISGQVPERRNGEVPSGFADQCHAVWDNIFAILAAAEMGPENLVKVTTYLTSAEQAGANSQIRQQRLGSVQPALTVLVVQTLDVQWLLEIEAIAAAEA